ncbi:hypothetical protein ACVW0K_007322 [Streptomyces filamentosus]
MPLDLTNPHEFSCFGTLYPDGLVAWDFGDPRVAQDLTDAYATVPLDAETDMHHYHCPGSPGDANVVAQHVAACYGFGSLDICGAVRFTGPSGETDRAPGIAPDAFDALHDRITAVCGELGIRLWSKIRPSDTVSVRYTDLERGDVYWFLNSAHRVQGFRDLPADSKTLAFIPEARYLVCDDEEVFLAYGSYECRADRAPAGYWQRTGNQLLPA